MSSLITFAQAIEWAEQRNALVMKSLRFEDGLKAYWDLVDLEIDLDAYQHLLFCLDKQTISIARQFFPDGEPTTVGFTWYVNTGESPGLEDAVCLYGPRSGEHCDVRGSLSWEAFRSEVERHVRDCVRQGWTLTGNYLI